MVILSVDYGSSRTGLAKCDEQQIIVTPLCVIAEKSAKVLAKQISQTAKEISAEKIVVGLPLNMNGTEGERAELSRKFAEKLSKFTKIPVDLYDERLTTVEAYSEIDKFSQKRKSAEKKQNIDAYAAAVLLEYYLGSL